MIKRMHDFEGGKYTLVRDEDGRITALRYRGDWREFVGDKFIHILGNAFFELLDRQTPAVFTMHCPNAEPHDRHSFTKLWRKIDLPNLREPEIYPESWNATYRCPGIEGEDDE